MHPYRHVLSLATVAAVAALLAAGRGDRAGRAGAAPGTPAAEIGTYRLVDTWSNQPWTLTAGRIGLAADVSTGPDGRIYVLDGRHGVIHVLAPDARGERVLRLPANPGGRGRLDVAPDGTIGVLSTYGGAWARLDRLAPDGRLSSTVDFNEAYVDVALGPGGDAYLVRRLESVTFGPLAVDVFDATARWRESIRPAQLLIPLRVDVAADGTTYILHEPPPPPPSPNPGPWPTPGPSAARSPAQPAPALPGVLVVSADRRSVEAVTFYFGVDVAVGPPGAFVARYNAVFPLRESQPLSPLRGQRWEGLVGLAVARDGAVVGAISHCFYEGVLVYDTPVVRPAAARLPSGLDGPELEGPVYPLRLDAGGEVAVLQQRYTITGQRPGQSYSTAPSERHTVQHWTPAGELGAQLGVCPRSREADRVRDLTLDGSAVMTIDRACVQHRPDDAFPQWTTCLDYLWRPDGAAHLTALDADAGRIAVLDSGGGAVVLLDAAGLVVDSLRLTGAGPRSLPVDIALNGERVYLADQGQAAVEVRSLTGERLGGWPVHDVPARIAAGPDGDLFVLGRSRWGLRYGPNGELRAAWRLPDAPVEATDLAVDGNGRVVVGFVGIEAGQVIRSAGIWVFEPAGSPPPPVPPLGQGCRAEPSKRAQPSRLPLGDEVQVTLEVHGTCPPQRRPVQLAIVFDTSRSFTWNGAITQAQQALLALAGRLDPRLTEVALVKFDDSAALVEPLTRDLVVVGARLAGLLTGGDTRLGEGVELGRRELTGPSGDPQARRILLLVSDGVPYDEPQAALAAARADGIEIWALLFQQGQAADPRLVSLLGSAGAEVLYDPEVDAVAGLADVLWESRDVGGLFQTITIVDEIPPNMRYVPASAQPPAQHDPAARTLTWSLGAVEAAGGLRLTYRLTPLEVGTWPTNVRATAGYLDALGQPGELAFPIPQVTVYAGTARAIYLPFAVREHCFRSERPLDVVLVLDTSMSMTEPAVGGGTKLEAARAAAGRFLTLLPLPADRAAIVAFNRDAQVALTMSGDAVALEQALRDLEASPGTRIDLGLEAARGVLAAGRRPSAQPVVILLTDGNQNGDPEPVLAQAEALRAPDVLIYAIGLGADVDRALLQAVAGRPERYLETPTATELGAIYHGIAERLACEVGGGRRRVR
jgi:Mg-chelatase subunit ChlD